MDEQDEARAQFTVGCLMLLLAGLTGRLLGVLAGLQL